MREYQTAFLAKFSPLAYQSQRKWGVPAVFTLAQHLVESAWKMEKLGHNYFGIKATSSTQKSQVQQTHEYVNGRKVNTSARFRGYNSAAESYDDHGRFLRQQPRYAAAFRTSDPVAFAWEVARAGYATDPKYFEKLRTNILFLQGKSLPKAAAGVGVGVLVAAASFFYFLSKQKTAEAR